MSIVNRASSIGSFALVVLASFNCGLRSEEHHTFRFPGSNSLSGSCIAMSPRSDEFVFCPANEKVQLIRIADGEMSEFSESNALAAVYSVDGSRVLIKTSRGYQLIETGSKRQLPVNEDYLQGALGIRIEAKNGKLLVQELLPGGAGATSQQIQVGEEITGFRRGFNGEKISLIGQSISGATGQLQGLPDTVIKMSLVSKGEEEEHEVLLRRRGYRVEGKTLAFEDQPIRKPESFIVISAKDGLAFASALDGFVYAGPTPETVTVLQQHAVSRDRKQFAILGPTASGPKDYSIEVFDAVNMTRQFAAPFPLTSFFAMRYSPDGKLIYIASQIRVDAFDSSTGEFSHGYTLDNQRRSTIEDVKIADPAPGKVILSGEEELLESVRAQLSFGSEIPGPLAVAIAVSDQLLATAHVDGHVTLWSLDTGTVLKKFPTKEREVVNVVEFTPDGKWLVFYRKGILHVVEVADLI